MVEHFSSCVMTDIFLCYCISVEVLGQNPTRLPWVTMLCEAMLCHAMQAWVPSLGLTGPTFLCLPLSGMGQLHRGKISPYYP